MYEALNRLGLLSNLEKLQISKEGKPFMPGISFSISHSNNIVGLAIDSSSESVGLDIEWIETREMAPFSHFFHTTEMQYIHQHVDSISAFYLHWSVKESALKYMGYGIDRVLDFKVDPDNHQICYIPENLQLKYEYQTIVDSLNQSYSCACITTDLNRLKPEWIQFKNEYP